MCQMNVAKHLFENQIRYFSVPAFLFVSAIGTHFLLCEVYAQLQLMATAVVRHRVEHQQQRVNDRCEAAHLAAAIPDGLPKGCYGCYLYPLMSPILGAAGAAAVV